MKRKEKLMKIQAELIVTIEKRLKKKLEKREITKKEFEDMMKRIKRAIISK